MTFLATTLYVNKLYQEQTPRIIIAQDGSFIDNVAGRIKDYVSGIWDGKRPFASIVSFLGPGLIFKLGFPWLSIAYEVAGALGFDWVGFWDSVKTSVFDIVKNVMSSDGPKPTEEELHKQLSEATNESLERNTHNTVDEKKLQELSDKAQGSSMPKSSGFDHTAQLIKEASLVGSAVKSRGLLSTIFRKIIPWVITRAMIALGFAVAGGAARGALGIKDTKKQENDINSERPEETSDVRPPIYNLQISKNVDPDLFEFNKNDVSSVWLETGSIDNIQNILLSWILSAYPTIDKNKIINSGSFIKVENMFRERNKLAQGLQIYSVPKPFQKKIDIVSYIVNSYLKTQGN